MLKYRLLKTGEGKMSFPMPVAGSKLQIRNANANPDPNNEELNNIIRMEIAHGQQPIRLVRQNANWNGAGKSAELHVYSKDKFGLGGKGLPSDTWPDRFLEWLKAEGF